MDNSSKRTCDLMEPASPSLSLIQDDKKLKFSLPDWDHANMTHTPSKHTMLPAFPEDISVTDRLINISRAITELSYSLGWIRQDVSSTGTAVTAIQADMSSLKVTVSRMERVPRTIWFAHIALKKNWYHSVWPACTARGHSAKQREDPEHRGPGCWAGGLYSQI